MTIRQLNIYLQSIGIPHKIPIRCPSEVDWCRLDWDYYFESRVIGIIRIILN